MWPCNCFSHFFSVCISFSFFFQANKHTHTHIDTHLYSEANLSIHLYLFAKQIFRNGIEGKAMEQYLHAKKATWIATINTKLAHWLNTTFGRSNLSGLAVSHFFSFFFDIYDFFFSKSKGLMTFDARVSDYSIYFKNKVLFEYLSKH